LFPHKHFEFFGYDIDFHDRYPRFDENGNFKGWQEGYAFDREGVAHHNGVTYYNASMNPQFNPIPQRRDQRFVNTFDTSQRIYDVIINSMFYSVFQMNGEPEESLDRMRENLLSLRNPSGVVFLNTCDDCFKIFPAPNSEPLPVVVPFICSIANIEQKVNELLSGGNYCGGVYGFGSERSKNELTQEEKKAVEKALYRAHRLARSDVTFLDRLFEAYEMINRGSTLDKALESLTDPNLVINHKRRAQTREKMYAVKQGIELGAQ
ncbi:hypothetical protein HY605_02215, partial [Candidatus Peregrinibacteria bacterium]|nr:hypothetical protein [Candidatus Peregrinibacteria bacterium]